MYIHSSLSKEHLVVIIVVIIVVVVQAHVFFVTRSDGAIVWHAVVVMVIMVIGTIRLIRLMERVTCWCVVMVMMVVIMVVMMLQEGLVFSSCFSFFILANHALLHLFAFTAAGGVRVLVALTVAVVAVVRMLSRRDNLLAQTKLLHNHWHHEQGTE